MPIVSGCCGWCSAHTATLQFGFDRQFQPHPRPTVALTFLQGFAFIARMRAILLILISVFVFSGCAHKPKDRAPQAKSVKGKSVQSNASRTVTPPPAVRPLTQGPGVIISVNEPLRFVVVDFSTTQPPPLNSRLNVYRAGQKVAELFVSGPIRNSNVVADIRAGEVKAGDEVRTE